MRSIPTLTTTPKAHTHTYHSYCVLVIPSPARHLPHRPPPQQRFGNCDTHVILPHATTNQHLAALLRIHSQPQPQPPPPHRLTLPYVKATIGPSHKCTCRRTPHSPYIRPRDPLQKYCNIYKDTPPPAPALSRTSDLQYQTDSLKKRRKKRKKISGNAFSIQRLITRGRKLFLNRSVTHGGGKRWSYPLLQTQRSRVRSMHPPQR